jgi:uncharacterized protein YkwD
MRILPAAVVAIAVIVVMSCSRFNEVYGQSSAMTDVAALQSAILELTLEERRKAGLNPRLAANDVLFRTAQEHSDDMVARQYFDHQDPDGNNSLRRLFRHDPGFQGALGENIAAHKFAPGAGFDPDSFAKIIVKAWLNSPGHKKTMLSPMFRDTGIGVAISKDEVFVTQLFAGPIPGRAEWTPPQDQRTSALTPAN